MAKKNNKIIQLPLSPENYIKTRVRNLPLGKCYINKDLLFYFDIICPWINFIGKKLKSNYNENVLIDIISSDNNEIIDKNLENFYNFIFDNL